MLGKTKYLIKGLMKNIPGIEYIREFSSQTGGTNSARYCYSVWLTHLMYAYENGWTSLPKKIAELGPGDSLGVGIAALISGADQYFALDVKRFSSKESDLKIFDELVDLFRKRSPLPDQHEFPKLKPAIENRSFPAHIFSEAHMEIMMSEDRLRKIRNSIESLYNPDASEDMITYMVPWNDTSLIKSGSVDMIISQGVLQYVHDLQSTYRIMFKWLKPKGLMSHAIPCKSLDSSDTWFGQWEYSDLEWKIITGKRPFYSNREPYSTYIKMFNDNNFKIICEKKITEAMIDKNKLARRFENFTRDDLSTSGCFIQAIK